MRILYSSTSPILHKLETKNIYTRIFEVRKHLFFWLTFLLLFFFFSFAYSFFSASIFNQDWDSLMYAYGSEVKGMSSIWGNHPLPHVIFNSLYILLRSMGYQGKALSVHIIANSITGGFTAAFFFYALKKYFGINTLLSLGYALIFGGSYAFWYYSGTAGVYSLAALMALLSWTVLVYEINYRNRKFLFFSGITAGLSILTHQLNVVFLFAALFLLLTDKGHIKLRFLSFFSIVFFTFFFGYLVIGYIAISSFSIPDMFHWLRGYVGNPEYGIYLRLDSIPVAVKTALSAVVPGVFGGLRLVRLAIYVVLVAPVLVGITQVKYLDHREKMIMFSVMIQCSINSLLIVWFEPFYTPFWLLTFVPGLILFSYSVEAVMSRISLMPLRLSIIQRFIPIFFVLVGLVVFSHNLKYAMINNNKIDASSQAALNVWIENSDENDMLITAGDLISQLWFYSDRPNTIHLYHMLEKNIASADRFEYFKTQIDRTLCSGGKVIVAPDIASNCGEQFLNWLNISREDIGTFFASYPKEKYFTYKNLINGKDTQVYTITKPDSCDE